MKSTKQILLPTAKSIEAHGPKDYLMLFYGPPGVGKTTFANNMAKQVLFLSTDRGTRFQAALRIECHTWRDFEKVADALEENQGGYDIVCIDHAGDWTTFAEDEVCSRLKIESLNDAGFGKGWKAYKTCMTKYVQRLLKLDMGVIFIAHETIKTVTTRSIALDRTMPDLPKTGWKVLIPLMDLVGYCGYQYVKNPETGKKREVRVLETRPKESMYVKDRTLRARPEKGWEPLDGERFIATFTNGAESDEKEQTPTGKRGRRARS